MEGDLDSDLLARVNLTGFGNWTDLTTEDLEEIGLTDLQTVILACLATIIPLTIALLTALIARCFWKKYLKRKAVRCQGSLHSVRSEPRLGFLKFSLNRRPPPSQQSFLQSSSCDDMKTSESQFSVLPAEEVAEAMSIYSNGTALSSKSTANGSIITLTMRNNHLIVEKEERIPGVTPLPSKPFISQGDTTIYTVDVEEESFREYADQYYGGSVSRTTSRDLLIHREQHADERYFEGRSGYSVVPEDNCLPYRKAWDESDDDPPLVIENKRIDISRLPLPNIDEYDEIAEKKKMEELEREKEDIKNQILEYQRLLNKDKAELMTYSKLNINNKKGECDSNKEFGREGELVHPDDCMIEIEDLDDDLMLNEGDSEDGEEDENVEEEEEEEAGRVAGLANTITILNNDHLQNIRLPDQQRVSGIKQEILAAHQQVFVGDSPLVTINEMNGDRTDYEDPDENWSTEYSDEEFDDPDEDDEDIRNFLPPRDSKDFYRIENRKYDNLACMQISEEEKKFDRSSPEASALPENSVDLPAPINATNVDDYEDFYDDEDEDDKSNLENASVTTEINVSKDMLDKSADSDAEKDLSEEKSRSSSSSEACHQNDYSYGNQTEYTTEEPYSASSFNNYYKSSPVSEVKPKPPEAPSPPAKVRDEERELLYIEQQHQLGKGFKTEMSLPGVDTFLSRTIISNNLGDSSDLN